MNREELEIMFNEKFFVEFMRWKEYFWWSIDYEITPIWVKQFIFNTIIPEVLKEILPTYQEVSWSLYEDWFRACIKHQKQKAKENFWIDL
jgi:hypothetical protein